MAKRKKIGRTPAQNFVISRKIEQLESEGLRSDRATAAAFRMHRDKELDMTAAPKQSKTQLAQRKATKAAALAGFIEIRNARKRALRRQKRLKMRNKSTK
jgi:hypothetical protein